MGLRAVVSKPAGDLGQRINVLAVDRADGRSLNPPHHRVLEEMTEVLVLGLLLTYL